MSSNNEVDFSNSERRNILEELERLKRDNSYLRMRLNYLESENGNSTCNSATINSKSSKLSKWHRVKGALGWEKDKDDMLKVPNSSSDSPFSLSPSGSCLSHSSIGTHYTLPVIPHLSSSSSDEELHVQERRCKSENEVECKDCALEEINSIEERNKSFENQTDRKLELQKKHEKMSKEECQPHHRTPWSKVKCIIHHHSKGASRKRTSCNHLCEKKNEKWRTLSEEVNVEAEEDCMLVKGAAPKLTVSLPSSEELRYEKIDKKYEVADNPNASEISPPLVRKSKWLKVRDVFLQGSRSAPTSPVRSDSFAYDLESDEVSSGEILGDKDDEVFDDNENLRYEIEASYIELQNRLTEEFTRKMEEIAHNSDIKQRLKKTSYNNRSVPQEVIVPTSTGLFRFEGISDKFTRKLYEWEVARGITPEESTFALLDPQYKPLPNKTQDYLVEHNNGIVKSKSIGSLVDLGNSNQEVIAHHRTSSLSLNDVDIQASRLAVSELKENHVDVMNSERSRNASSFTAKQGRHSSSNSIGSNDSDKQSINNVNCRQVVDTSYQLLQENISLLDKLKKERDVCRQLEDDMIHLEGQIHNVSKSFQHQIADNIDLTDQADDRNLHRYDFDSDYHIDSSHNDLTICNDQIPMNSLIKPNLSMKLENYEIENSIHHVEPIGNTFYQENLNLNRGDQFLIQNLLTELIEMAERLESAVLERDKEIFHLKSELYRKDMVALHGNHINTCFSSFTMPIHRLRSRRSQELSSMPKQILDKLLELKEAISFTNPASHLIDISSAENIGQPSLSPHTLRRCTAHEDLSPEPPVQSRSIESSPASSFSYHGSYNADESPNEWIPHMSAHNRSNTNDDNNSSDWIGVHEQYSSYADLVSEDGVNDNGPLINATNVFVPTTRKIFSPVSDTEVIEYVIGEELTENNNNSNNNNNEEENESIKENVEIEEVNDEIEMETIVENEAITADKEHIEDVDDVRKNENYETDIKNNNSILTEDFIFPEFPAITKDIEELRLGDELSSSLKMRAMKIQKAKEDFLRGTRTGSLSIVIDSLESNVPNTLLVKSASETGISFTGKLSNDDDNKETSVIKSNCNDTNQENQTKSSKSSLLSIFRRTKRKSKDGAVVTLARQSLTMSYEPTVTTQTISCPSSPELQKRNDTSWIKNPAKMIFRPKGKYMINNNK